MLISFCFFCMPISLGTSSFWKLFAPLSVVAF
ncbi:hypothetical protein [Vibrio phage vB_pir03]|nr:hypothetical protein [Vibrio phage vB_pir03]